MTKEQLERLLNHIDARILMLLAQYNCERDTSGAFERVTDTRDDLLIALGLKEGA